MSVCPRGGVVRACHKEAVVPGSLYTERCKQCRRAKHTAPLLASVYALLYWCLCVSLAVFCSCQQSRSHCRLGSSTCSFSSSCLSASGVFLFLFLVLVLVLVLVLNVIFFSCQLVLLVAPLRSFVRSFVLCPCPPSSWVLLDGQRRIAYAQRRSMTSSTLLRPMPSGGAPTPGTPWLAWEAAYHQVCVCVCLCACLSVWLWCVRLCLCVRAHG
jgi:hypothetical protein